MSKIVWVIPEERRRKFDEDYQKMIKNAPEELWIGKDYMPYWDSELPFPIFSKSFTNDLPNEYRQYIRNIYDRIFKMLRNETEN
jgi:hypothetical protein